jgi:hypothetical protein
MHRRLAELATLEIAQQAAAYRKSIAELCNENASAPLFVIEAGETLPRETRVSLDSTVISHHSPERLPLSPNATKNDAFSNETTARENPMTESSRHLRRDEQHETVDDQKPKSVPNECLLKASESSPLVSSEQALRAQENPLIPGTRETIMRETVIEIVRYRPANNVSKTLPVPTSPIVSPVHEPLRMIAQKPNMIVTDSSRTNPNPMALHSTAPVAKDDSNTRPTEHVLVGHRSGNSLRYLLRHIAEVRAQRSDSESTS